MTSLIRHLFECHLHPESSETELEHEIIRDKALRRRILGRLRALERAANISYEQVRETAREQEREDEERRG